MTVDKPLSDNETASLFIKLTSIVNRINISNQFVYIKPVEIELGAGDAAVARARLYRDFRGFRHYIPARPAEPAWRLRKKNRTNQFDLT